jgi:transposase
LTSAAVALIAPDTQLTRLGSPEIVVGQESQIERIEIHVERPTIALPIRRGRLFFFDEANVSWCPQSGRVYRIAGEEARVETPGQNNTAYMIGSVEYPSGEGLYEIYPHKTHLEVQAHWQHLLAMYPHEFLYVVRDNASSHVTPELDPFLLEHKHRFGLVPLPTYSPHLNLIERLWHYMREQITRSQFYPTFKELCEALVNWLQTLPFERFRSLMGLGSDP